MELELILILTGIAVLFIGITYWEIKKSGLKEYVLGYILEAEKKIATGDEKFQQVCENVANLITSFFPRWVAIFITATFIEDFVQKTFDAIKEILDYRGEKVEEESN